MPELSGWTSKIADIAENQIPFVVAGTLNLLAQNAAEEARTAAAAGMNIKKRSLLTAFIRAPNDLRATKARFRATVVVAAPKSASPDRGSVLAEHEAIGLKTPFGAQHSVASPSRDIRKPGDKRSVLSGYEYRNLAPLTLQSGLKGHRQFIGGQKPGTFLVTLTKGKSAGIKMLLQRFGRGAKTVRGLWLFVPQTRLKGELHFAVSVKRRVSQDIALAFKTAFSRAIASARPLSGTVQSSRIAP